MPEAAPTPSAPAPSPQAQTATVGQGIAPRPSDPSPPPAKNLNNAFASLESLYSGGDEPPPSKGDAASAAKPSPDSPGSGNQPSTKDNSGAPNATQKQPDTKPPENPPQPERAGELRKQRDAARTENETLKARVRELEKAQKQAGEDPERKSMEAKLAEYEKKTKELDERLRYKAYEESDDYKSRFYQPFLDAYSNARQKVATLKVVERKDDMENVVQQARQGTPEDFDQIMRQGDDDVAGEMAERLFGRNAPTVIYHREKVQELNGQRVKAIEDFRKTGLDREANQRKQFEETSKGIQKETNDYWQKHLREPIEKYPHLFKEVEGDEKGNELLRKGMDMAVMAFKNMNPMDPRLTSGEREQVIAAHAAVFNWATAGPRLAHQNKTLKAKVAELEKDLEAYEKTESPGASDGAGRATAGKSDGRVTMNSVLADLEKRATPLVR